MPDAMIDRSALVRLLATIGGDRLFLIELIKTFIAETPTLIAAMRQAIQRQDAEALRRAAHTLKSNGANFGALKFSQISKELEDLAKQGALPDADARIQELELVFQDVQRALLIESQDQDAG